MGTRRSCAAFIGRLATFAAMGATLAGSPACQHGVALPERGAVLLDVTLPSSLPAPDALRAWVYDRHGVIFKATAVPQTGALPAPKETKLGTILIQPGAVSGDLRVHLRAYAGQARTLDGIVVVTGEMWNRPSVTVGLDARIPADADGDDVPDVIDDCLPGYNPDQGGCLSVERDAGAGDVGHDDLDGAPGAGGASGTGGSGGGVAGAGGANGQAGSAGSGVGGSIGTGGSTGVGGSSGTGGSAGAIGGSTGCGVAPSGAAEGYVTIPMVEGGVSVNRQYWLSRPASYNATSLYKVVIALGSPANSVDNVRQQVFVQGTSAPAAADEIFVYPLARVRNFGSWGTGYGWELGPGARNSNAAGMDDVAFIDAMYADVTARFCIDTSRVFIVGYGWGSDFANALACVRGDRLRAVAGAGNNGDYYLTSPTVACTGAVGNWVMQGKGDTHLGLSQGMVTLNYWLAHNGCANATQPLAVAGPNGNESCVSYSGCTAPTRWCAYDASFGVAAPSYLGREALGFFRAF